MGPTQTKNKDSTSLLPNEIHDFQSITSFSDEVLIKLHNHYKRFSSLQTDDGVIDYAEFSEIINRDNNMTKRIFNAIDINKDGVINFREFIKYISCFVNGTLEERVSLSFKLFADDKSKLIFKDHMVQLLLDIISAEDSKFIKMFFTKSDIVEIVESSFTEINKALDSYKGSTKNIVRDKDKENQDKGVEIENDKEKNKKSNDTLDFKGYKIFIEKNPQILDWLVVDLEKIKMTKEIVNKSISKKVSCFGC